MTMQHFSSLLQLWSQYPARKNVQLHCNILLTVQAAKNTPDGKYKRNEIFAFNRTWGLMEYSQEEKIQNFSKSNKYSKIHLNLI